MDKITLTTMKLSEFDFKDDNHFVALEYYALILNRTLLVLVTPDYVIGIKANGILASRGGDELTTLAVQALTSNGDLNNPYSYLNSKYLNKVNQYDLLSQSFLNADKANFYIRRSDIVNITYNPAKKWGMGEYPHDGKVYVTTKDNKRREFIILGKQSGEVIKDFLSR